METKKKQKAAMMLSIVGLLGLLLVVVGGSYAFFTFTQTGSKMNAITTGTINFSFNETSANGITISNALPVSDATGKAYTGVNKAFDFSVGATTTATPITYDVAVVKDSTSTLADEATKIYLTTVSGSTETAAPLTVNGAVVKKYSELGTNAKGGKTVYTGKFNAGSSAQTQAFRLRMWIADTATSVTGGSWTYGGKTYKVKVAVYAAD